jgi:FAD/FMN-containing dehydrogenase
LLARFAGNEKGVAFQCEQAATTLKEQIGIKRIGTESEDGFIWARLAATPPKLADHFSLRATVSPANLDELLASCEGSTTSLWQAGVADGRMRIIETDSAPDCVTRFSDIHKLALALGGDSMVENAPNLLLDYASVPDEKQKLVQRIKAELDAKNLFRPGCLTGGAML